MPLDVNVPVGNGYQEDVELVWLGGQSQEER